MDQTFTDFPTESKQLCFISGIDLCNLLKKFPLFVLQVDTLEKIMDLDSIYISKNISATQINGAIYKTFLCF